MVSDRIQNILDELEFENGLVTAIVQDYESMEVLMVAYMNKEALVRTLDEEETYFWSRSREELWKKGEVSGHKQVLKEMRVDCDGDSVLLKVNQIKGACHTGHFSCFFKKVVDQGMEVDKERVFDPEEAYGELK